MGKFCGCRALRLNPLKRKLLSMHCSPLPVLALDCSKLVGSVPDLYRVSRMALHQLVGDRVETLKVPRGDPTMRHYVLAEEETQREAAEALAEVFGV